MVNSIAGQLETQIETQISFARQHLLGYRERGLSVCVTSSFQTHSIPLLHILASVDKGISVYFLDTGFHFPETLAYRDQIAQMLDIQIQNIRSGVSKAMQVDATGKFFFVNDPDHCCFLNKVQPMEMLTLRHQVWISGVRRDQSSVRKNFAVEAPGPNNSIRFHPMLDWDNRMIYHYIRMHNLPKHPLDALGYVSVGCAPCTAKPDHGERSGRWIGLKKTECGLHTTLAK